MLVEQKLYGYLWIYILTLFPYTYESRIGWLFFSDPKDVQRKSMKSKFFPLKIHIGLHFESSGEKSGKFQGGICRQIYASPHFLKIFKM